MLFAQAHRHQISLIQKTESLGLYIGHLCFKDPTTAGNNYKACRMRDEDASSEQKYRATPFHVKPAWSTHRKDDAQFLSKNNTGGIRFS